MSQRATVQFTLNEEYTFLLQGYTLNIGTPYPNNYETHRNARPSFHSGVGTIDLVIEADGTHYLAGLAMLGIDILHIKITVNRRDQDSMMKTFEFENGFVMSYIESFSSTSNSNILVSMSILCRYIELMPGGYCNDKDWDGVLRPS